MTLAHFVYIPLVLGVGFWLGHVTGSTMANTRWERRLAKQKKDS
jgi:hypothetical protein